MQRKSNDARFALRFAIMSVSSQRASRPRLDALVDFVLPGSRVADIGTDQGVLPRRLLAEGRAIACIATERDRSRLARARGFPEGHRLAKRLELRAGNGLEPLHPADGIDVVVIAGLGSSLICRILEDPRRSGLGAKRLVLQPQTAPGRLRRWLRDNGLGIVRERLVRERGRFFPILAAEEGFPSAYDPMPPLSTDDILEAGPLLVRSGSPEVALYWTGEVARLGAILRSARSGSGRASAMERSGLADRVLSALAGAAAAASEGRPDPI